MVTEGKNHAKDSVKTMLVEAFAASDEGGVEGRPETPTLPLVGSMNVPVGGDDEKERV